jgi:two-component system, response regulator
VNNKNILLIEDNPDDVALAEIAFKKARIPDRLLVANDGKQALNYLFSQKDSEQAENKPDLILLDLKLPVISGLEVLRIIKANRDTLDVPVIVLTSSSEEKDQKESYRLGASAYIRKPTSITEFIEIIKQIKAQWLNPT